MASKTDTCQLVSGKPYESYELALVVKLTFTISANGNCVPADKQLPLVVNPGTYDDVELPFVSPPDWDSDLLAFKPGTDVVVQGHAYNYTTPAPVVDAEVQVGKATRTVRVHGDRRLEWQNGRALFSQADVFERMPIRYDRAYGGYDNAVETSDGELFAEMLATSIPEERWDTGNRQYYPRNPAGCGYVSQLSREAVETVRVPNLEFPFDPVTPSRLAIGAADNWMNAPLPAAFDWIDPSWFPRIGYLGLTPEHRVPPEGVREIAQGWATRNLLQHKSILSLGFHPTFQHGASPCLIQKEMAPGARIILRNLCPDHPERQIQLANKSPRVRIHLSENQHLESRSHLGAIVIRPDDNQLIEVWSARTTVSRPYGPNELADMNWKIQWN